MSLVTSWSDLVREAAAKFPCVDPGFLQAREGPPLGLSFALQNRAGPANEGGSW